MIDTPQDIKEIQLKIWLSKSPMERLRQMMLDNEALNAFWKHVRILNYDIKKNDPVDYPPSNNVSKII